MMTKILGILGAIALSSTCLAGEKGSLEISGTISKVEVVGPEAVLSFKGIGRLYESDPAVKDQERPLALRDTRIHLQLDFQHLGTYVGSGYLESLNKKEAIARLKQFQAEGTEVFIDLNADSMHYSSSPGGLGVSNISGSPILISEWKCMFKEGIAERHKDLGIDYHTVIKVAEQPKPEPPKITHENLYQMEELVKQGADPNAPYWLYPGLP